MQAILLNPSTEADAILLLKIAQKMGIPAKLVPVNDAYNPSIFQEEAEVYRLSPAEKRAVDDGLADIAAGRVITHEQLGKKLDEWLES